MSLERTTIVGESPVDKMRETSLGGDPSITGHEKPCENLGRPFPKAKYYLVTDSELVPRGKGEKAPREGS